MTRMTKAICKGVLIPCMAMLALGAFLSPAQAGQKALLIGINVYPHMPPDKQLSDARQDALAMKEFLVEHWNFPSSDIRLLLDRDATKARIMDALYNWLPSASRPGDRVVMFFSGHGTSRARCQRRRGRRKGRGIFPVRFQPKQGRRRARSRRRNRGSIFAAVGPTDTVDSGFLPFRDSRERRRSRTGNGCRERIRSVSASTNVRTGFGKHRSDARNCVPHSRRGADVQRGRFSTDPVCGNAAPVCLGHRAWRCIHHKSD